MYNNIENKLVTVPTYIVKFISALSMSTNMYLQCAKYCETIVFVFIDIE